MYQESFEDLQINSNWKFKPLPLCPLKWWPFKVFMKLHKSLLLIANLVKGAALGLGQFLATESLWKLMKDAFYFVLKALFVLKIFKFLSWLFGHVQKTVWFEIKV